MSITRQPAFACTFEGRPRTIQAVIFDGDGVLFNSEELTNTGFRRLMAGYGLTFTREQCEPWIGLGSKELLADVRQRHGVDINLAEYVQNRDRIYKEVCSEEGGPHAFGGINELLDWLAERNVPVAVASGASPVKVGFNLERSGLLPRFETAVTAADVIHGKPAPDIYIEAARRLGVDPRNTAIAEDTLVGLRGGRAAGGIPVAIVGTYRREVLAEQTELVFDDHHEWRAWFERLQAGR